MYFFFTFFIFQMTAYPVENQESIDRVRNENTVEEQPFLRIETEDTSENPTTMRDEDEIMTGARKSG